MKIEKLHTHPKLEQRLGLSSEHVIIDRETFEYLLRLESSDPVKVAVQEILTYIHFSDSDSFHLIEQDIKTKWL